MDVYRGRPVAFPAAGAIRVAVSPSTLYPAPEPSNPRPAVHRFDDPEGVFAVRYFATTLRGALCEVLDQFRAAPNVETLVEAVEYVEGVDILTEERAGRVPEKWLAARKIGRALVAEPAASRFIDVMDENLLAALNTRDRVRKALAASPEAFGDHPRLDFGSIQSSGLAARSLTQAVAREIYESDQEWVGLRYVSRHTEAEECWAVFDDRARVVFDPEEPFLDVTEQTHADALRSAADLHRLILPPLWS